MRAFVLTLLLLATLAAWCATVTVNGKTVTVPMIEQNGKAYVDVVALMALLGGKATYDANAHKVAITDGTAPAPAGNGGGNGGGDNVGGGIPQLPGEWGDIGKTYVLSKSSPIFITLLRVEYTTAHVTIGANTYVPKADQKLLVLHYILQNGVNMERLFRGDQLRFTAVDADNTNFEAESHWGEAAKHAEVDQMMKPAQKLELYSVIFVPANNELPKLMVQPAQDNDGPILRFNLKGKVAGVGEPYADPADKSGATARTTVPGKLNVAYPCQSFTIAVEKMEFTNKALNADAPDEGGRFMVATLLVKNMLRSETLLRSDVFEPVLTSTDGETLEYQNLLLATANRTVDVMLKPGQEFRARIYFTVPKDVTPKTLAIKEGDSRTYEFEAKETPAPAAPAAPAK